jgi:hypothetical protein
MVQVPICNFYYFKKKYALLLAIINRSVEFSQKKLIIFLHIFFSESINNLDIFFCDSEITIVNNSSKTVFPTIYFHQPFLRPFMQKGIKGIHPDFKFAQVYKYLENSILRYIEN